MNVKIFFISLLLTTSSICALKRTPEWDENDFKNANNILELIETQKKNNDKVIEEAIKRLESELKSDEEEKCSDSSKKNQKKQSKKK